MVERRAIVIGSQCEGIPNRLPILMPDLARSLFRLLIDEQRGGCVKARSQLVLNPDLTEMKTAMSRAVESAAHDGATLIVAFIGDIDVVGQQLYLLPRNGTSPPTTETSYLLSRELMDQVGHDDGLDGLLLLLDGARARVGAEDATTQACRDISLARVRVQQLAATHEGEAWDACLVRTLQESLYDGMRDLPADHLLGEHITGRIARACRTCDEGPTWTAFQRGCQSPADPGLWLAHNVEVTQRRTFRPGTPESDLVAYNTRWFEPTEALELLVAASSVSQLVVVEGEAGSGKSALCSALAEPRAAGIAELGIVPTGFVHALVFASLVPTPQSVVTTLRKQLSDTVYGFVSARDAYEASLGEVEATMRDRFDLQVIGPLRQLHRDRPHDVTRIRIVLDGWHQLAEEVRQSLEPLFKALSEPDFGRVRIVVTTRPGVRPEAQGESVLLGDVDGRDLVRYLSRSGVRLQGCEQVTHVGQDSWVRARLLVEMGTRETLEPALLTQTLDELYAAELGRVADRAGEDQLRPVLSVLAATGDGPVLPLSLLTYAGTRLGAVNRPARVRDVLAALGGLVVRAQPGTDREQVGLSHDSLTGYLIDQPERAAAASQTSRVSVDITGGHRAIVQAIDALAPVHRLDLDRSVRHYAALHHAEHLWALGEYSDVLTVLESRQMRRPSDNLDMWRRCLRRIERTHVLGPTHPVTLRAARNIARWTGLAGDMAGAVRLLSGLRLQCEEAKEPTEILATDRELARWITELEGPLSAVSRHWPLWHPDTGPSVSRETLEVWREMAHWTGELGRPADAVRLLRELLPVMEGVLWEYHPDTLATRHELGRWTAEAGAVRSGLEQLIAVLEDQQRHVHYHEMSILITRHSIAYWTGESGHPSEAVDQFRALLSDAERVYGKRARDTLMVRHNLAHWIGQSGHVQTARDELALVLAEQERILPIGHRDTLATQQRLSYYKGQSGQIREALDSLRELRRRERETFLACHVHPLRTKHQIAHWTGELGHPRRAMRKLRALVWRASRALGADHPDVFAMRSDEAHWTGESGHAGQAKKLLERVREDMRSAPFVAGEEDPRVIVLEARLAYWIGESGDPTRAAGILRTLAQRAERVLSENHRKFTIERNLAYCVGRAGDPAEARERLEGLSKRECAVLGSDHPHTLLTRQHLAYYYGRCGLIPEALQRLGELLVDQRRALGRDHPSALRTEQQLAQWKARRGGGAGGLAE